MKRQLKTIKNPNYYFMYFLFSSLSDLLFIIHYSLLKSNIQYTIYIIYTIYTISICPIYIEYILNIQYTQYDSGVQRRAAPAAATTTRERASFLNIFSINLSIFL